MMGRRGKWGQRIRRMGMRVQIMKGRRGKQAHRIRRRRMKGKIMKEIGENEAIV
jgi:hypothetical protein